MYRFLPQAAAAAALSLLVSSASAAVLQVDLNGQLLANSQTWTYDVDADGSADLRIRDYFSSRRYFGNYFYDSEITAYGLNGARVSAGGALAGGAPIGESLAWTSLSRLADKYYSSTSYYGSRYSGTWTSSGASVTGYLGFRFDAGDGTHYGWLNLTVDGDGAATLHGLAWEDVAGVAILAGSTDSLAPEAQVPLPASAGLIAAGLAALGMAARRRG